MVSKANTKNQTIAELENYYATKNNGGRAWLMAIVSLVLTVAVIAALFFAGRWIYKTFINKDDKKNSSNTAQTSGDAISISANDNNANNATTNSDSGAGTVSDQAATTTKPADAANDSNASAATPASTTTQQTSPATQKPTNNNGIPSTGAGSILWSLPLVAGIVGYLHSRRKQNS